MYNEEDIWLAITPSGTAIHYHHGPGIDEPLVAWTSYDGGYYEPLYYFADALGSIRAAKGQDWLGRDMSATYEFDSFGQLMSSTSTLKADWPLFTFTAREADSESNLLYLRARYYDPRAGRFVSEDPAKFEGEYPYAANNPVLYRDPYGLQEAPPGDEDDYETKCNNERVECMKRAENTYNTCVKDGTDECRTTAGGSTATCYLICSRVPWYARWACKKACNKGCEKGVEYVCDFSKKVDQKHCELEYKCCLKTQGQL